MPARKASIQDGSGDCGVKKPILATRCCAWIASDHVAAAALNAMNSRRRITASTIRAVHCNYKPGVWKMRLIGRRKYLRWTAEHNRLGIILALTPAAEGQAAAGLLSPSKA